MLQFIYGNYYEKGRFMASFLQCYFDYCLYFSYKKNMEQY